MSRTGGGKEVLSTAAVVVGVGVGVAALTGLGLAGLGAGVGVLSAASFAHRPKPPLQPEDVRRDEQGRIENWAQVLAKIQQGGVAPELRAELWPLLLRVFPHTSTQQERSEELQQLRRLYIKLVLVCRELDAQLQALRSCTDASCGDDHNDVTAATNCSAAGSEAATAELAGLSVRSEAGSAAPPPGTRSPLPLPGNLAAFAEAHRIVVMDAVRTDLRRGVHGPAIGGARSRGGAPTLTVLPVAVGDGLPELMMVGPAERDPADASTAEELAAIAADPGAAAAAGRLPRWRSHLARDMLWGAAHLDDPHRCQMLRLVNILSAYAVHDPETGYCQGMSDLASVFVQLLDDDALAFACFERLMRAARRNFRHDETGIRHQLQQIARVLRDTDPSLYRKLQQLGAEDCMFAYRMVVVMLRRELAPVACCTLWEMQWAHEAADAEAAAAAASGTLSRSGSSGSWQHQAAAAAAAGGGEGRASGGGASSDSAAAAAATAAAGLRSTVKGLSQATASARAVAEGGRSSLGQRPDSAGSLRHISGRLSGAATADLEPPEFVLQFIAAVVRAQRGRIMGECREHDDVLRLFNSLQIDFWPAVAQARKQHRAYVFQGAAG